MSESVSTADYGGESSDTISRPQERIVLFHVGEELEVHVDEDVTWMVHPWLRVEKFGDPPAALASVSESSIEHSRLRRRASTADD